jgi:hypothetical protein
MSWMQIGLNVFVKIAQILGKQKFKFLEKLLVERFIDEIAGVGVLKFQILTVPKKNLSSFLVSDGVLNSKY